MVAVKFMPAAKGGCGWAAFAITLLVMAILAWPQVPRRTAAPGQLEIESLAWKSGEADQTTQAFKAAWGQGSPAKVEIDAQDLAWSPAVVEGSEALIHVGDKRVLVSAGMEPNGSHAAVGRFAVHYFDPWNPAKPISRFIGSAQAGVWRL